MKCISLWQPWASLCVIGAEHFETRRWQTDYSGPLLIHAAKRLQRDQIVFMRSEPCRSTLEAAGIRDFGRFSDLPLGKIVGVVDLVDMFRMTTKPGLIRNDRYAFQASPREMAFGDFGEGRYAWQLKNPRRFKNPIPYRGLQQLFNVPDEVVAEQLRLAVAA